MARIELDIYSGLPNPTWELSDADTARLLDELAGQRDAVSTGPGPSLLGFRGLVVHLEDDAQATRLGLPHSFRLGDGQAPDPDASRALAERLLQAAPELDGLKAHALEALPGIPFLRRERGAEEEPGGPETRATGQRDAWPQNARTTAHGRCQIEVGRFYPGFWNGSDHVGRNNCYAYGCNMRTDTFPQPGRYAGRSLQPTLQSVRTNSLADGALQTPNCAPTTSQPRWLVALVTFPDNAWNWDYHWYRLQDDGYWCHKPGGTPATDRDNNGNRISNPETCARGGYTVFGGYFYIPVTANIR